jgi:DNA-binding XRE family transcriptional regulator
LTSRLQSTRAARRLRTAALPFVDNVKMSRHPNMKELRPLGGNIRILFAFDPRRTAILLIGGDKRNRWDRWYDETVPIADRLYDEHLEKFGNRRRAVMSGRKNFDELRHKLRSDAGARVKVDQYRHVMKDALALADLREERRVTQQEVADKLGISQPNISRVEHQEDVYLSTLRGYVDVLGGHLEVRAVFSDQTVTLDVPASQAG